MVGYFLSRLAQCKCQNQERGYQRDHPRTHDSTVLPGASRCVESLVQRSLAQRGQRRRRGEVFMIIGVSQFDLSINDNTPAASLIPQMIKQKCIVTDLDDIVDPQVVWNQ